jgi:hypothetical protein
MPGCSTRVAEYVRGMEPRIVMPERRELELDLAEPDVTYPVTDEREDADALARVESDLDSQILAGLISPW